MTKKHFVALADVLRLPDMMSAAIDRSITGTLTGAGLDKGQIHAIVGLAMVEALTPESLPARDGAGRLTAAGLTAVGPVPVSDQVAAIARACVARLAPHTQRSYLTHITSYLSSRSYSDHVAHLFPLSREGIQQYLDARKRAGAGPVTLNQALSALKLLSREVWIRGLLAGDAWNAISDIRSEKRLGKRLGQWTGEQGVETLIEACADGRERALIAVMCGCGLRRGEVASLRWSHYQEHAGRMCLVDLIGKGSRIRTVAVPIWAAEIIDDYKMEKYGN